MELETIGLVRTRFTIQYKLYKEELNLRERAFALAVINLKAEHQATRSLNSSKNPSL